MDHISSMPFFELFELSMDAAQNDRELGGILRAARSMDRYSKRFAGNNEELRQAMIRDVNGMIGRDRFPHSLHI
jgi:hypothetical protein